jgi:hypothetical protein
MVDSGLEHAGILHRSGCRPAQAPRRHGVVANPLRFAQPPLKSRKDGRQRSFQESLLQNSQVRHSREGGNPEELEKTWNPAFAGMTLGRLQALLQEAQE